MCQRISLCLLLVWACSCGSSPDAAKRNYVIKGDRFYAAHKYPEAALNYKKAIRKDPNFGEAHYKLGLAGLAIPDYREAFQAFYRAVELEPANVDAKIKLADLCLSFYLGDARHAKFLHDQAANIALDLLKKAPGSYDGLRLEGEIARVDGDSRQAIELFRHANEIKPMQPELVLSYSQALFLANRAPEGERLALDLLANNKTFGPIYDVLTEHYLAAKRMGDAEGMLKAKVANNPRDPGFILQLAWFYHQSGRQQEMLTALERVLNTQEFPDGYLLVGSFYAKGRMWEQAAQHYAEGAAKSPKQKVVYQKGLMDALIAQNKLEDARQVIEDILKQSPDDLQVLSARANLMVQTGNAAAIQNAIVEFNSLVKKSPGDAVLRYSLGRAYHLSGDLGAAGTQYREALKRRSDYMPARQGLLDLSLMMRRPSEALRYADELIAQGAGNNRTRLQRAASLIGLAKYDEARTELTGILKSAPRDTDAQLQLGLVYIMQKRLQAAQDIFQRLHNEMSNDLRPLQGLVQTYVLETQTDAALELLHNELKKNPNASQVKVLLGDTAFTARKYDLAIEEYQQALASSPSSVDLYFRLGQANTAKGDPQEAIPYFQKAASLNGKDGRAWAFLASAQQEAGQMEEAKANYKRALSLYPGHAVLMNNLAYLIADTGGNLDDALKYAQEGLHLQPENPNFADTVGLVLFKRENTDTALQIFSGLSKKYPDNPSFRYHFAMALLKKGDKNRARNELNATLSLKRSKEEDRRIQDLIHAIG